MNFHIILSYSQHVIASFDLVGVTCIVSFVYASASYVNPRFLWDFLSSLAIMDPWLFTGDFNVVMGTHETIGSPRSVSCDDFHAGVTICNLIDLDT